MTNRERIAEKLRELFGYYTYWRLSDSWLRDADKLLASDAMKQHDAEVRAEVQAAVEEWFTDVSLDDLFAVKGWALAEEGEIEADAPGPPGWNPTPPEGGYTAKDF